MKIDLRHGDCLVRLDEMGSGTVEFSASDPPYDLKSGSGTGGFMGKDWDGTGIAFSQEFWSRLFRVMAPGGVVKVFGGTRTFHRMCAAMEKAGFDLNPADSLEAWTYGSGFPKSHNVAVYMDRMLTEGKSREIKRHGIGNLNGKFSEASKDFESQSKAHTITTPEAKRWEGWGTALKPAWEPIVVGRKPSVG